MTIYLKDKYFGENDMDKMIGEKKNKGFTLVELIVVLVILAILAAILIPALLGYIDRAKEKKEVVRAKNCLTAAQVELTEYYAAQKPLKYKDGIDPDTATDTSCASVISDCKPLNNNGDVMADGSDFANKVFTTADDNPYCFIIATGSTMDSNATKHDRYTIYYAFYMETDTSMPLYYYDGKWVKENPRNIGFYSDKNEATINGKKMKIQYYVLANAGGKSVDNYYQKYDPNKKPEQYDTRNIWTWLKFVIGADDPSHK